MVDGVKQLKMKTEQNIEKNIKKVCGEMKDSKEKRFCYYIGGTEDAATSMLRVLSGPLMNGNISFEWERII